jgi:AcrR family transcriptional regulator
MTTAPRLPRGRPASSSREEIERLSIELFLEHGYEATTLAMITAACRISRTSFFRYYSSKAEIIWWAFDVHTRALRGLLLDAPPTTAVMESVRASAVAGLRRSIDAEGIWMKRFRVLDSSPALQSEESAHWLSWARVVAEFVAERCGLPVGDVIPQSIGGAVQAAFLAVLRSWKHIDHPTSALLAELDEKLTPLCDVLQNWLDTAEPQHPTRSRPTT